MLIKTKYHPSTNQGSWKDALQWGDIIMFRFPIADSANGSPPKARPCLVFEVTDIAGCRFVTLVSGNKAGNVEELNANQTLVATAEEVQAAGLKEPYLFDARCRITISVNHHGFQHTAKDGPVIGQLTGADRQRFNRIRAKVRAHIDMAISHRRVSKARNQQAETAHANWANSKLDVHARGSQGSSPSCGIAEKS